MKILTKTTPELSNGDVVVCHDCIFQLIGEPTRFDHGSGPGLSWRTKLVEYTPGPLPEPWARDWRIQGNSHAQWEILQEIS